MIEAASGVGHRCSAWQQMGWSSSGICATMGAYRHLQQLQLRLDVQSAQILVPCYMTVCAGC